jgi:hypothetical protein
MGSPDGSRKHPYIRESRRIVALTTVREHDVSVHFQPGPRAAHCVDSVGVGWYPIDIHRAGEDDVGASCRTRPFQIPLGALVPVRMTNLIAAAKNIGTTHITNGCYRLHPVEWNIGEAAGALAAFALQHDTTPGRGASQPARAVPAQPAREGLPLAWIVDVGVAHPVVQRRAIAVHGEAARHRPALRARRAVDGRRLAHWGGHGTPPATRAEGACS